MCVSFSSFLGGVGVLSEKHDMSSFRPCVEGREGGREGGWFYMYSVTGKRGGV